MAVYDIIAAFADGSTRACDTGHDDLGDACRAALSWADRLSRSAGTDRPQAKWVSVFKDGDLEISVQVMPGAGLAG